jgi:hypothetical protein
MKAPTRMSPLKIAEVMAGMNTAASLFASSVDTVTAMLRSKGPVDEDRAKMLATTLEKAASGFRAAIWPEGS